MRNRFHMVPLTVWPSIAVEGANAPLPIDLLQMIAEDILFNVAGLSRQGTSRRKPTLDDDLKVGSCVLLVTFLRHYLDTFNPFQVRKREFTEFTGSFSIWMREAINSNVLSR